MRTRSRRLRWAFMLLCSLPFLASGQTETFNFKRYLTGAPSTLLVWLTSVDTSTGIVQVSGNDSQGPSTPFRWEWDDGSVTTGFFPQSHTYADRRRNYTTRVVSTYSGGGHDTTEVVIWFVAPDVTPVALPPEVAVHIPSSPIVVGTRLYDPPTNLAPFDSSFFPVFPRSTLEYVLSVAAAIQNDLVNDDVYLFQGAFEQYMLRDSTFGGAYSLWFTDPVTFGVGDGFITGGIDYSSLFHEMGHNFTLNTPADFYFGGRIDGDANAIFSETMAQIFQHATGYEIVNSYQTFGLDDNLIADIRQQVVRTIKGLRESYETYLASGKPYSSWNDPSTPDDETFGTFMTLAFRFCVHAEEAGAGYRLPVKRMLTLLQGFGTDWAQRYDQMHNTAAGDSFRATLMVSAISYAFAADLRAEFRDLNFPIDDQTFFELYNFPTSIEDARDTLPAGTGGSSCYPNPFNASTVISFQLPVASSVNLVVYNLLGREVARLADGWRAPGRYDVTFDATGLASGVYFYKLAAGNIVEKRKLMLVR